MQIQDKQTENTNMKNIYQRLNKVKESVKFAEKTANTGQYKAVTHDEITAITRGALIENGVMFTVNLKHGELKEIGRTKNGAPNFMYDAIYTIDFINVDNPQDKFSVEQAGQAVDAGDKAAYKALSLAVKYCLLKLLQIESGENDESRQDILQFQAEQEEIERERLVRHVRKLVNDLDMNEKEILANYKREKLEDCNDTLLDLLKRTLEGRVKQNKIDARENDRKKA